MKELLVSGCPRSGTTALLRFFNNDPRIFLGHELGFFVRWNNANFHEYVNKKFSLEHFAVNIKNIEQYGVDAEELKEKATEEEWTGNDFHGFLKENLPDKVEYFGDKQPYEYLNAATELLDAHPTARMLIVLRDGRDVIASQIRNYHKTEGDKSWWMKPTVEKAQFLWAECAGFLYRELKTCSKNRRFMVVRYEDMTFDPADFCQKVSDFLELDTPMENNGILKRIRIGDWRKTCPDVMERVNGQFKQYLKIFGYI